MATTIDHCDPALARPAQAGEEPVRKTAPAIVDTLLTVLLALYPAWAALGVIGLLIAGASA